MTEESNPEANMSDFKSASQGPAQVWQCEVFMYGADARPEFRLTGPWPTERLKIEMVAAMTFLLDGAPERSSLKARIERIEEGYRVQLVLAHAEGVMRSSEWAVEALKATQKSASALQVKIQSWREPRALEAQSHLPRAAARSRPRVLIVDDNPISIKIIEACLAQLGCEISVVTTGRQAVREMIANDYDLLVLDWVMPEMDGAATLLSAQEMISFDAAFRLPWLTSQLPVVTYSGQDVARMGIPECANFDVVAHISKTASYPKIKRLTTSILGDLRVA